jgi:hypothetical protein
MRGTVLVETLAVAVPAVLVDVLPGIGLGSLLLGRMVDAGVAHAPIELVATWRTATAGAVISLLSAAAAAVIAGRRATMVSPVLALAESADAPQQSTVVSKPKLTTGVAFVVLCLGSGIGTLFMANGPLLTAAAGPACIAVAIGLALLSPAVVAVTGRAATRLPSGVGRLALRNLDARAARASTVVGPPAPRVRAAAPDRLDAGTGAGHGHRRKRGLGRHRCRARDDLGGGHRDSLQRGQNRVAAPGRPAVDVPGDRRGRFRDLLRRHFPDDRARHPDPSGRGARHRLRTAGCQSGIVPMVAPVRKWLGWPRGNDRFGENSCV